MNSDHSMKSSKTFKCKYCKHQCDKQDTHYRHLARTHLETQKYLICVGCNQRNLTLQMYLDKHLSLCQPMKLPTMVTIHQGLMASLPEPNHLKAGAIESIDTSILGSIQLQAQKVHFKQQRPACTLSYYNQYLKPSSQPPTKPTGPIFFSADEGQAVVPHLSNWLLKRAAAKEHLLHKRLHQMVPTLQRDQRVLKYEASTKRQRISPQGNTAAMALKEEDKKACSSVTAASCHDGQDQPPEKDNNQRLQDQKENQAPSSNSNQKNNPVRLKKSSKEPTLLNDPQLTHDHGLLKSMAPLNPTKLLEEIVSKNQFLLSEVGELDIDLEGPIQDFTDVAIFNDSLLLACIGNQPADHACAQHQQKEYLDIIKANILKTFGALSTYALSFKGQHEFKIADIDTMKGLFNVEMGHANLSLSNETFRLDSRAPKIHWFLQRLYHHEHQRFLYERYYQGGKQSNFCVILYQFRLTMDMSASVFIQKAKALLKNLSAVWVFMMNCDFTADLGIGFSPDALASFLDTQFNIKTRRTGQFCLKYQDFLKASCTVTVYNKLTYYMFMCSHFKKIGSMLAQLFKNDNCDLQAKIDQAKDSGLTRVEMRFEQWELENLAYYEEGIINVISVLRSSRAFRLQPLWHQWQQYVGTISDCLLYVEETTKTIIIGWSQNNFHQSKIQGTVFQSYASNTTIGKIQSLFISIDALIKWILPQYFPCSRIHLVRVALKDDKRTFSLKQELWLKERGPTLCIGQPIFKSYCKKAVGTCAGMVNDKLPQLVGLMPTPSTDLRVLTINKPSVNSKLPYSYKIHQQPIADKIKAPKTWISVNLFDVSKVRSYLQA